MVSQTVAGLVDLGFGVLERWRDLQCEVEDDELHWKHILIISFTTKPLSVGYTILWDLTGMERFNGVVNCDLKLEQLKYNPSSVTF